jgi:predicted chitinase
MASETRNRSKLPSPGPFLAEVTNHLDPTYMGALEVAIIKGTASSTKVQGETYVVKYLSPFAGNTSIRYEGTNPNDFNDVQKSYGFWAVPPDVGTTVMVLFIDGDPNQGYWFGCVQDIFQNHMTPGIAASRQSALTDEQRRKYGTDYLPVAEFHKSSNKLDKPNPNRFAKPIHPFADRLLEQGLLLDTIRGVTSSSARREVPSGVFGISTPGPVDDSPGAKKGKIGYDAGTLAPVSRLGGSSFVMDDGDIAGQNELVRLRTRTGHQILLHNSQDLIYISNSKGTAWVEMTSNGKIDIYAQDSVSIHTENDFNFRADRDINIEAGRNINVKAGKNMETNITGYHFLTVDEFSKVHVRGTLDQTIGDSATLTFLNNYNFNVSNNTLFTTGADLDINTGATTRIQSGADTNIKSGGNHLETAAQIHMNGPSAASANTAGTADLPPDLPLFSLPNRSKSEGWDNGKFYKTDDIKSIMQRVPTHEPWDQHENVNPVKFSQPATDTTLANRSSSGVAPNPASSAASATEGAVGQEPANQEVVPAGTCTPEYSKDINASSAAPGIAAIKAACAKYGLTSPYAIAALLGIAGGECRWRLVEEGFKYSADRLLQVFPSVFKGDKALAQQYAGNPNNILPEFLYGYTTKKGKGLGNTQAGDGAKYIGRGYIQLTGRGNYKRYGDLINQDLINNPALLNTPAIAAEVSVKYMLDRCKASQTDPGYFESACKAVGYNTPDIKAKKKGYYECFLGQLQGGIVGTGTGGIVTDGSGNPIKTGSSN